MSQYQTLETSIMADIAASADEAAIEAQIIETCKGRLADFKVPRKVLFLDEIPKGATGKLQRIGLAEKLGLGSAS